jgi:hypothetical protein
MNYTNPNPPTMNLKKNINPLPLLSPFNIFKGKKPSSPSLSTQEWKKKFSENNQPPFPSSLHMSNEGEKKP